MAPMPRVTRHLRVGLVSLLLLLLAAMPLQSFAATTTAFVHADTPMLVITEVQTSNVSLSEEFIEIYNATDNDIDLSDSANTGKNAWGLQFFSSSNVSSGAPDWTKTITPFMLSGVIPAHNYFLLASTGYKPGDITADQTFSSRLSDDGGALQIVQVSGSTTIGHDTVAWKKVSSGQSPPAGVFISPSKGGSLQRLPNEADMYTTEEGDLTEFVNETFITPKDIWQAPVITEPVPEETPEGIDPIEDNPSSAAVDNTGLEPPMITELLPNPALPLKDETDEYIELYNPNDAPFDLKGYTLEVGTSTLKSFTFSSSTVLAPLDYQVFYSADTRLALTNTGSQVRLLDPADALLSETLPYTSAAEGAVWAFHNGSWQWSSQASPNTENIIAALVGTFKAVAAPKTTAKKSAAKTTSAKVKGANKTKTKSAAKTKTKKAKKPKVATVAQTSAKPPRAPIHPGVLVTVVGIAVLYALYEYRHDLQNRIYKLRRHRTVRSPSRATA